MTALPGDSSWIGKKNSVQKMGEIDERFQRENSMFQTLKKLRLFFSFATKNFGGQS
jgi:hypothetical protein